MIFEYANSLEGYLGDYILPSLEVMLNMVTDKHSSDLRISASQAIAPLFKAVMDNSVRFHQIPTDQVPALLDLVLSKLLETIRGEINSSARESSVEALRDVVEACYESGNQQPDGRYSDWVCAPTLESSMAIISELVLKCHESVQRRAEKEQAIVRNEGLDAEDRETYATELESEEDLLSCLVEVISEFFKIHRNNLMPFVDQNVAPHFAPYLAPSHPKTLQVVSVCLLDDIIEYGGDQACQKYLPHSINTFLKNLKSSHLVLRQCSAYGLAQGLRRAPIICEGYLNSIIPALLDAAMTNSDEEENEGIIENAIFGLGFVLVTPSYRNIVPPQNLHEILNLWLESLPLTADNVESKISLLQFCELLEDSELVHVVLGASLENLPSVIRIIADVFIAYQQAEASGDIKNCIVHPDTMLRVRNIWEQWKQNQQISSCMESFLRNLTPQQQQVLTS